MSADYDPTKWGEPRLVNMSAYRLALRQAGRGRFTVVLEMGVGAAGSFYDDIAQRASHCRAQWTSHQPG